MTPKGGIVPHKRFSIQANRAEVLFVDYIVEHLTIKGRAGIIVPEGIIFQSNKAYTALRKKLVEDGLFAVVSLPAGVFNPYAGVKTSVLLFDNEVSKQTKNFLFVKIQNDGFDLGAQRREHSKNDLPLALQIIKKYKLSLSEKNFSENEKQIAHIVAKEKIIATGDYNLSGDRYKEVVSFVNQKWEMVELGEVLDYEQPTKYIVDSVNYDDKYKIPVLTAGQTFILGYTNENEGIFPAEKLPVIIFDDFTTAIKFVDFSFKVKSSAMKILHAIEGKAEIKYLFHVMKNIKCNHDTHKRYWISKYSKIKIPLPPLEVQKEIVEQIEVKQNAIDHAKAIIQNLERERRYFGQALIRRRQGFGGQGKLEGVEWMNFDKIVKTITPPKKIQKINFNKVGKYPIIDQSQNEIAGWTNDKNSLVKLNAPVVIFGDHTCAIKYVEKSFAQGADGIKILIANKRILPKFLYFYLKTGIIKQDGYKRHFSKLRELKIPLPSLEIQKKLVAEAEKEQQIINANKQLIEIMEQKISDVLSEI